MGEEIEAKLFAPQNGTRVFVGDLIGYEGGVLRLSTKAGEVEIPRASISAMNTTYHE